MANRIDVPNWYQIDFDITTAKDTLVGISSLIRELKKKKLLDKWFYLFEGKTIRVRIHSDQSSGLQKEIESSSQSLKLTISEGHSFEQYWESDETFPTQEVVKTFADIMSSLTELTITRIDGSKAFSNYILAERLSHCIFNNIYGSNTEEYFLLKRITQRLKINLNGIDDNPEQTVLDNEQNYQKIDSLNLAIGSILVPIKKGK